MNDKAINFQSLCILGMAFLLGACSGGKGGKETANETKTDPVDSVYQVHIKEFTKEEYPDNPSIGHRSKYFGEYDHDSVRFVRTGEWTFNIQLLPVKDDASVVTLKEVNLERFIPYAPNWVQEDDYLTYITLINQEWNRQQVKFLDESMFDFSQNDFKAKSTTRVDIARNCLNEGLWEAYLFKQEDGKEKSYYHGWFDFPDKLYTELFEKKHEGLDYEQYEKPLETWVEPPYKKVDLSVLRKPIKSQMVDFETHNDQLYPVVGGRAKKHQNVVYPREFNTINDFLTDSARFATFKKPGYYSTDDPRHTELGRLYDLKKVTFRKTLPATPKRDTVFELSLKYDHRRKDTVTRLIFGGLRAEAIPQLPVDQHHKGWKNSMGIANHTFYKSYDKTLESASENNPYFGMFTTKDYQWLDSHKIGVDGPVLHWDEDDPNLLHVWLLSFERHAMVGHYTIEIPESTKEAIS